MEHTVIPLSTAGRRISVSTEFVHALFAAKQDNTGSVWKRNRYPFITSTITSSIMDPRHIERTWFERMQLCDREEADDLGIARMKRGSALEPIARAYFEKTMDVRVFERGLWVNPERPHTGVSPDGFVLYGDAYSWNPPSEQTTVTPDAIPTDTLIEIKCPSMPPRIQGNGTFIRDGYIVQVMDAMDKLKCNKCYFVILETEREMEEISRLQRQDREPMPLPGKLHVFLVHRSDVFIEALRCVVDYFTTCLEMQVQPAPNVPITETDLETLWKEIRIETVMQKDIPDDIHEQVMRELNANDAMEIDT
jgi:hypothetical protein